jgi:hypothetical protein
MLCSELRRLRGGCGVSSGTTSLLPRRVNDAPNPLILRPILVLGKITDPERDDLRLAIVVLPFRVDASAPTTKSTTICTEDFRRSPAAVFLPLLIDDLRTAIESVNG